MSLKKRVFAAGGWILFGFFAMQVLRVGSNLILTRLLFPEAFGLMVVVFAVNIGVNLLSDLGIASGIIVHSDGSDPSYLNTAWTIQIVRGCILGLVMFICARPLALAFSNIQLEPLIRIVSLVPVILGFTSTSVALADRQLDPKRRVSIDLGMQIFTAAETALLAWTLHSTVALAWGSVISTIFTVVVQHLVLRGPKNRLHWDKSQVKEIVSFGQMAFFSSALLFASSEGSRLFSATMVDTRMLGLIGLASGLSGMPWQAIQTLSQRVLMPAYAEVFRSGDKVRLKRAVLKARLSQIIPCWLINVALIVFATPLFHLMYDARYAESAYILQIQCVGMLVAILTFSYNGLLVGMRRLGLSFGLQAVQSAILWAGMYFGFQHGGALGLVVGTALASWVYYPFAFIVYRRLGVTNGLFDAFVLSTSSLVALALWKFHT